MKKRLIILLILLTSIAGYSQTEKLLVPSDLKQQTVVTEPVTLRKGYFRAGLLLDYRVSDKYFDDKRNKEYVASSSFGSQSAYGITIQYGIADRLQVEFISEYMDQVKETKTTEILAATNTKVVTTNKNKGLGVGDSHLAVRYQIISEKDHKLSLSGSLKATFPTGEKDLKNIKNENRYDLPVGDGVYALGVDISARTIAYPWSFSGNLGYRYNFKGTKIISPTLQAEQEFRIGNFLEAGLKGNLHLNEWIVFGNEINYYNEGAGEIDYNATSQLPASWALSYEPDLIFQVHRFRLGESVRIPVIGRNIPADPLYMLIAQYVF